MTGAAGALYGAVSARISSGVTSTVGAKRSLAA